MGRELQKRKARSSRPTVRPKILGRTKAGKKKINFLGNEIIAKNWDRSLTLEQNYKRLGLSSKLNAPTGGTEHIIKNGSGISGRSKDPLAIIPGTKSRNVISHEVKVERHPITGRVVRIIQDGNATRKVRDNPLNDPLNDLEHEGQNDDDDEFEGFGEEMDDEKSEAEDVEEEEVEGKDAEMKGQNDIVSELEAQALEEAELLEKKKRPRQQSSREEDWIATLIQVHGDNYHAMFRDRKLNPMQQSEGDIKRRIRKWQQKHG